MSNAESAFIVTHRPCQTKLMLRLIHGRGFSGFDTTEGQIMAQQPEPAERRGDQQKSKPPRPSAEHGGIMSGMRPERKGDVHLPLIQSLEPQ